MDLVDKYLKACSERDQQAHLEQKLEDRIFAIADTHSISEIDSLIRDYRVLKLRRMEASLTAARLFMQLSPDDRKAATEQWSRSAEGIRKAQGSGIRGFRT